MSPRNSNGRRVLVFGAGGHGKCVAEALLGASDEQVIGFIDDDPAAAAEDVLGLPVLGTLAEVANQFPPSGDRPAVVVGVGDNRLRERIVARLVREGFEPCTVIHPSAVVCRGASVGAGSMLMPHSTICTDAHLGRHVIVNTNASVDHDCRLGDFVHVAPGTHLGGNVTLGTGSFLGIGVSVLPGVRIGEWVVVGAGAVVNRDVPSGATVVGVPARPLRKRPPND